MELLTFESCTQLLGDVAINRTLYLNESSPFIKTLGLKTHRVSLEAQAALKLPDVTTELNGTDWDREAGPKIHQMLNIPRSAASDRRIWVTLAHNQFYSQVRERWLIQRRGDIGDDTIKDRFFWSSSAKKRNGIGMLWWTCERLYDALNEDPYHYARPVLHTQRLTADLFERPSWTDNREITLGALDAITQVEGPLETINTERFRECLVTMSYLIGQVPPDILTRSEFSDIYSAELSKTR